MTTWTENLSNISSKRAVVTVYDQTNTIAHHLLSAQQYVLSTHRGVPFWSGYETAQEVLTNPPVRLVIANQAFPIALLPMYRQLLWVKFFDEQQASPSFADLTFDESDVQEWHELYTQGKRSQLIQAGEVLYRLLKGLPLAPERATRSFLPVQWVIALTEKEMDTWVSVYMSQLGTRILKGEPFMDTTIRSIADQSYDQWVAMFTDTLHQAKSQWIIPSFAVSLTLPLHLREGLIKAFQSVFTSYPASFRLVEAPPSTYLDFLVTIEPFYEPMVKEASLFPEGSEEWIISLFASTVEEGRLSKETLRPFFQSVHQSHLLPIVLAFEPLATEVYLEYIYRLATHPMTKKIKLKQLEQLCASPMLVPSLRNQYERALTILRSVPST